MTRVPEAADARASRIDEPRLQRLLGGPELQALRRRLRARYERGAKRDEFTLNGLAPGERRALESLLGRPALSAGSMRIKGSELDAVVARAGLAADFRAVLESLDGPLIDRKAARLERERDWRLVIDDVAEPRLRSTMSDPTGAALLKRLAGGDPRRGLALLERARLVLERLPARGVPLAQLAAETLGDSHALDSGRPVAALVLRACGAAISPSVAETALVGDKEIDDELRRNGDSRRDRWARAGVSINELAMPVLCLNLRARADTPAAVLACAAAEIGDPVHLNLRALLRWPPAWDVAGRAVYVCENPAVVAVAADHLGRASAPLVCTDGMPGAAPQTLLRQLSVAGARLRYHGDFDWPGLAIGNFVMRNFAAEPWRFGAADYGGARIDVERQLPGRRVAAVWDQDLAGALAERNVVVHEEAVIDKLLADLACG